MIPSDQPLAMILVGNITGSAGLYPAADKLNGWIKLITIEEQMWVDVEKE